MPAEQLLILGNPRGRRRDSKGRFLKRSSAKRASNPRGASKKKRKGRARSVTTVTRRVARYQRNPRGGFMAVLTQGAMPAAIGAGGALAADFMLSYLPLPAQMRTGVMRHVGRAAAAVLLGGIASYVTRPALALQIGSGALTVAFHGALKDAMTRMLPPQIAARLGDYDDLDLAALGIYSPGPVEEEGVSAFERTLDQIDDDGLGAFEQSINGLGDTVEL